MTDNGDGQVVSQTISLEKGDALEFTKDNAAFAVAPKDDDQATKVFSRNNKLQFAEDFNGILYLNKSTAKLWAGQFTPGYYLAGVDGEWEAKLGLPAQLEGGDNPQAQVVEDVTLTANSEIKFIQVPNSGSIVWFKADAEKIHAGEGITATRVTTQDESDGNLKIEEAGEYDIYYNPTSGWYIIR